jgi:hypothetical protein
MGCMCGRAFYRQAISIEVVLHSRAANPGQPLNFQPNATSHTNACFDSKDESGIAPATQHCISVPGLHYQHRAHWWVRCA